MTVKAYDRTCSDTRDVTVTVTDVDGEGMAPLSSQEPVVGAEPTASLTDADGGITGENWQWARCGARVRRRGAIPGFDGMDGTFTDIATARSMTHTSVDADDGGKNLQAVAMYDDGHGSGKTAMVVVSDNMVSAGDPLIVRCDANGNGEIDQSESITEING